MNLTFLTPRLPPSVCGVGDHTVRLALALRDRIEGATALYIHEPAADTGLPFDRVDQWNGDPDSLAELLRKHHTDCLWVQFSGYGFAWQALPQYLVRALRAVRSRVPIVVYFHETHCFVSQLGWKGIVLSPLQRHIGKSIAACANAVITSCEFYRQLIDRHYRVPRERSHLLSLGSNIQVPVVTRQAHDKFRSDMGWPHGSILAVVFGSVGNQRLALRHHQQALAQAIREKLIHRIICVGGPPGPPPHDLLETVDESLRPAITILGHQTEGRIGEILTAADVALTRYPRERLGKSGAAMAYALAGLPLLADEAGGKLNGHGDTTDLIRETTLIDVASEQFDERSRRAYQENAAAIIGWPALATQSLEILRAIAPKCNGMA
jgi:hypothetical protein